jgi:ABC-type polysaccharide/polyol phosphate export systems, permease component
MLENTRWWEWEIKTETSWFGVSMRELYAYKDLLFRLVRKDFLSSYQQTLLGPFWLMFQPLVTVIIYVLVFHAVIGVSTEGIPAFLYYLIGITLWNLFSNILLNTSYAFVQSAHIFEKVYFPRLISPFSILILNLLRFGIQFLLLLLAAGYFYVFKKVDFNPGYLLFTVPVIIITSCLGFGAGLIFSIITVKYKDLLNLLDLFTRLLMFICPIFYSLAIVPKNVKWLVYLNPLSSQFEMFRYAFLGKGTFHYVDILYSIGFMICLLFAGIAIFNKWSDKLIDVV